MGLRIATRKITSLENKIVMKKILYFIIPVAMIAIAASFFNGQSTTAYSGSGSTAENCLIKPEKFIEADKNNAANPSGHGVTSSGVMRDG